MENILNRPAIKAEARNFIRQDLRWWKMTLATILVYIFSGMITFYINVGRQIGGEKSSYQLSSGNFVVTLLLLPFLVSIAGFYLNYIRGFNPEWKSLYKEGFDNYGKYFCTAFLVNLFTYLWTMLLIVPGIVMGIAYSQTKYIIHDNPNLKSTDAIEISKRMTAGFKGDLFLMYFSFFWWYILTAMTGGILFIYVLPYVETTSAMYYENLKRNAIDNGIIAPEAFGIMPEHPQSDAQNVNPDAGYYNSTGINPEDTFKPGEPDANGGNNQSNQ